MFPSAYLGFLQSCLGLQLLLLGLLLGLFELVDGLDGLSQLLGQIHYFLCEEKEKVMNAPADQAQRRSRKGLDPR